MSSSIFVRFFKLETHPNHKCKVLITQWGIRTFTYSLIHRLSLLANSLKKDRTQMVNEIPQFHPSPSPMRGLPWSSQVLN